MPQYKSSLLRIRCLIVISLAPLFGCSQPIPIISSLDELGSARIGVMTGSVSEQTARERYTEADVQLFDDIMDGIAALNAGQIDAVLSAETTIIQLLKRNPQLLILDGYLRDEPVSVGLRKGEDDLRADIDRVIAELRENGTLEDMSRRWFKEDLSPYEALNIPLPTEGEPLVVGVSATREPMSFLDADGNVSGHDGELARRIAVGLNRPLEFFDSRWASLLPALQAGRIDIIVTGMSATPERARVIDFSESYFRNRQVAVVRKAEMLNISSPAVGFLDSVSESFQNNIVAEKRYLLILDGLRTTIILSLLSTVLGTVLGAIVCGMRMSRQQILQVPARLFISVMRGTPLLVFLMILFYVVFASAPVSPVGVAVIAFGMHFAAYVSEMFRTSIESIDAGQQEAGISMGFTKIGAFIAIVLPQALQRVLPVYKGEFLSLVKTTSIVGYIAVHDLTKAGDLIRSRTFDAFFPLIMIAVLYFIVSWVLIQSLEYLERATDPKRQRRKERAA